MVQAEQLPLRIHVLRRINPLIACMLQSPLHRLASRRLLLLRYRGRKSGKSYAIPLAYVTHGGQIYCLTRNTQWWKNAVAVDAVELWLRGVQRVAKAERAASTAAETREVFARFLTANPGTARLLYNVRVDAHGEPDAADIEREVHHSNVVRFTVLPGA